MKVEEVQDDIYTAFVRSFIRAKPGEYAIDGYRVAVALAAVAPLIRRAALEEAAGVVNAEIEAFSAPAYAGGPTGAFCELFACRQILTAIRALDAKGTPDER